MSDSKEKTVSIRVPESLLEWMKDEQYRRRKMGKPEPSYQEIILELWVSRQNPVPSAEPTSVGVVPFSEKSNSTNGTGARISPSEEPWVQSLVAILRSENTVVAEAIKHNLKAFELILGVSRGVGPDTRQPGAGSANLDVDAILDAVEREAKALGSDAEKLAREAGITRPGRRADKKRSA